MRRNGNIVVLLVLFSTFLALISIAGLLICVLFSIVPSMESTDIIVPHSTTSPLGMDISNDFAVNTFDFAPASPNKRNEDFNNEFSNDQVIDEMNEFICHGSCSCEDPNIRRSASSLMTRGISVMIASITASLAFTKAKESFQMECENTLSSSCSSENIRADLDWCEKFKSYEEMMESQLQRYRKFSNDVRDTRKFKCNGYCIPQKFRRPELQKWVDDFHCEDLYLEKEIVQDCTGMRHYERKRYVKFEFLGHLVKFCEANSLKKYTLYYEKRKPNPYINKEVKLCLGQYPRIKKINRSVVCRQMNKKLVRKRVYGFPYHLD